MKNRYLSLLSLLIFLLATGTVIAHVGLSYPRGEETFVTGEMVLIKWKLGIAHPQQNWDLYISYDGGANWEELKFDIDTSELDYRWTVPAILTENARIRIVQDNTGMDYNADSGDFIVTDVQTSIAKQENSPAVFKLHPNYPNPFNPTTTITYELPNSTNMELSVYNLLGQKVVTLVSGTQNAGYYSLQWDASNLSAGAYFIKLLANDFLQIKKAILLK